MRAPPLARYTVSYGAGLWAGLVVLVPHGVFLPLGAVAVLLALRGGWRGALAATALAGLLTGGWRAGDEARSCAARWPAGAREAWIRIDDAPDERGRAWGTVLEAPEGCGGRIRLRFDGVDGVPSGATLIALGTWFPPYAFRVERARVLPTARPWRFRIRDRVAARIARLYGPRAGIVEALVLGRRGDVDPALRAVFADAGLAHLLAISGLHVGLLAGWIVLGCSALVARRSAWGWAAAATWLYVALLGFPAPATRAAAFVSLHALARWRARHPPPEAVLAAAALVVVTVDPRSVTAIGAWMSVAAVWGTVVAGQIAGSRSRKAPWSLLTASAGAVLATAPLTAFAFGAVAPVGLVTNLVAIPLAGVAVPGVFLSLLAGRLPAGGAGLVLATLERIAEFGAALPGGHVTGTPGWRFALPWVLVVGGVLWLFRARPPAPRVLRRAAVLVASGAWVWVGIGVWRGGPPADQLTIHVLDVGQGDAIAIRTPRGRWLLVDAGPQVGTANAGERVVVPFLRREGVRALDALILSHGDADHLGGVPAVLRAIPAALVLEPGQPLASHLYRSFLGLVMAGGTRWTPARAGDTLRMDGVTLAVLHPSAAWAERELRPNENSIVVHLNYRDFDMLLTGDAGFPAESAFGDRTPRVEVLKVGHHGSPGSTGVDWLAAAGPRLAVISVGRGNRYGHPAPVVLGRLRRRGVTVYRTDLDGTVTIRTDGRYYEVGFPGSTSFRARVLCHVRRWLRSKASSWSRSACTPTPRGSSPTSFTTWPSPARSSPATSAGPD